MSSDYSERRDFIRMFVDAQVTFRVPGEPDCYSGQSINLSGSGLKFHSPVDLAVGQVIEFTLSSTQSRLPPLEGELRVVRAILSDGGNYEIAGEMIKVH